MLSIKSEADWDVGGCGGRLREQGETSAVRPALPASSLIRFTPLPHTATTTTRPP